MRNFTCVMSLFLLLQPSFAAAPMPLPLHSSTSSERVQAHFLSTARTGLSILTTRWKTQRATSTELMQAAQFTTSSANIGRNTILANFDIYVTQNKAAMVSRYGSAAVTTIISSGSYNLMLQAAQNYRDASAIALSFEQGRQVAPLFATAMPFRYMFAAFGDAADCKSWGIAEATYAVLGSGLILAGGPETPWGIIGDTFVFCAAGMLAMQRMFCAK